MTTTLRAESTGRLLMVRPSQSTISESAYDVAKVWTATTGMVRVWVIAHPLPTQSLRQDSGALALVTQGFDDVRAGRVTPYDPFADDPDDA